MQWWQQLTEEFAALDVISLLVNLVLAVILGQVLAWHFVRYAHVMTNRRKFARIFVFIVGTTLLMITVVKTSLALSLGLVGALSIIRFRTPIKEPEELAYLFMAIAVGVGLGADERLATAIVFAVVLTYLALRSRSPHTELPMRTVLHVNATTPAGGASADQVQTLLPAVTGRCSHVDLRRVDCTGDEFHASLLIELADRNALAGLITDVQAVLPGATVSVVERDGLDG